MFKKKNYKIIIGIIVGIIISSSIVVANSYKGAASDVGYDNSSSDLSSSNVQDALDELYDMKNCPDKNYCVPYKNELEVGDYVSYTPEVTSYPVDTSITGYTGTETQIIYPEELELWRVLNIYEDGRVDLISEYASSTNVYFKGLTGYKNFVGYLNVLASQYETEGITDAEDGSRYFGFNGQTEYITDTSMFTSTPPFGCSTDGTAGNCTNADYPNDPDDYEAYGGGDKLYTTDYDRVYTVLGTRIAYNVGTNTATSYWMASRYYDYYTSSDDYGWYGRYVYKSGSYSSYSGLYRYHSDRFNVYYGNYALRPIVTLKSGLEYEGLGTENNPMKIITS